MDTSLTALPQRNAFARYSWFVLAYNLLVILWGAYVRASGSGAGCGAHWPLCNGMVIPSDPQIETIIEFTHRVTSGFTLVLVLVLLVWAWRRYPRNRSMRWIAALTVFFTLTEAMIGARLVLFGLVAQNASLDRAYAMILHLVNTFLLTACIALCAWWASDRSPQGFYWRRGFNGLLFAGIVAMLVVGGSGAIAALGDTLFPVESLAEGLRQDFDPQAHILTRLRVIHPVLAVSIGLSVGGLAWLIRRRYAEKRVQVFSTALIGLTIAQMLIGIINVALLAPIPIQIIHLLVSDLVWLSLVLLTSVCLGTADLLPRLVDQKIHNRVDQTKSIG